MKTSDFNFELPQELIAQTPIEKRDASRLLVLDKNSGAWEHRHFYDLPDYLHKGDCLILNDSRVLPARLLGQRLPGGGACEVLLLKVVGSAAAPTAGLHFTEELLQKVQKMGVKVGYVTLHVGLGTFRPVKEDDITDHLMHSEYCVIPQETADLINETKKNGGRVICVGTTSCRTVESWAGEDGTMRASAGWTNIFIYPGYKFKVLDALITNFHLPESTLIMLVSALAGRENVLRAYEEAVRERYRFFSFGDAMFIH